MHGPVQRAAVVCVLAFLALAWNLWGTGLAAGYLDPVGRVAPQDEAVYSSTALAMLRSGDWLTPRFLDRYVLYKPPLAYWMSASAAAVLGPTPFAFRLPSLLCAALTVALVFRIAERSAGPWGAIAAALLVIQSPLFFQAARRNLMDAPLTLCFALAAWLLLDRERARPVALGLVCGAAILVKSIAGLLVLAMAGVALAKRPRALAHMAAVAAAVAAPWFLYQAAVHPHWLWRELMLSEILGFGTSAPRQTSQESHILFYVRRAWATDPLIVVLLATALWRRPPLVPAVWLGIVLAGALAFSYRNAMYLVPAVPAAAILVAPHLRRSAPAWAAVLAITFALRAGSGGYQPWGLPYESRQLAAAPALERYAAEGRNRDLLIVQPDDEFTATLLNGIRRVRYVYLGPEPADRPPLDFRELGIMVTVEEFLELDRHRERFRAKLREADLPGEEPVASVILAQTPAELDRLLEARPDLDFSLPAEGGREFRLARKP
jgi:4-amino-4-deoxy-L-arabinose transferase-like glycosyltransferase